MARSGSTRGPSATDGVARADPFAPGLLQRLPDRPRKVAIVRPARIGDFLLATPAFRSLRAALPGAEVVAIALPQTRDLVARSPHLDRFVAFPGFPGLADQFFDPRRALAFFAAMQAERFDLAVQLYGSGVYSNPFTLMLGARATAGFVRPGDPPGRLDAALPFPEVRREVERPLALTRFLGAPPCGDRVEFPLWPEDEAAAEELLAGADRPLIGVHPAGTEANKRWPAERFAVVGDALAAAGARIAVTGTGAEGELVAAVCAAMRSDARPLCGRLSLGGLAGLLAEAALVVSNDTGPLHLAGAVGTPTVGIYWCGNFAIAAPLARTRHRPTISWRTRCPVCDLDTLQTRCPHAVSFVADVPLEEVIAAARDLLADALRQPRRAPEPPAARPPGISSR